MPQLPLSLRSAFFCQPISGNEGQGQQHYQVTVAQNGIFKTLGLDPPMFSLDPYSLTLPKCY